MINRPLYVRKYHSNRLKEFDYNIENTFDESKQFNEIIGLTDSQILRTIRDVSNRTLNQDKVEILIKTRDFYRDQITYQQQKKNKYAKTMAEKLKRIKIHNSLIERLTEKYITISKYMNEANRIQDKINRTLFEESYITVVMDTVKQYETLYQNGFTVNGNRYKRLSCSAGQARVSTVVFCKEEILAEVIRRLNNGRDMNKKISPSKFNAYFGLSGSSTQLVSDPKYIVVKDYVNTTSFMANYVIENGWKVDDTIIQKEMKDVPMNRNDGMGLITYRQAKKWADELGLDYVPAQFCIRQNFMKGMVCVFPIHEFAQENGMLDEKGRCMVDTIYTDKNGNPIRRNLFDYEVIISESQFRCIYASLSYFPNRYISRCV